MIEQVVQRMCIKFCIKLEHSSMETVQMIQKAAVMGNWWLAASSQQCAHSCIMSCAEVFGKTSNHPSDSALLQPRFGALWLLAFPNTKITFERDKIWDLQWNSGKYNRAADGYWENCVRPHSAYFEEDWSVIVPCTVFLVSCIFFNKCLYFSHYTARCFLDRPHMRTCVYIDFTPYFLFHDSTRLTCKVKHISCSLRYNLRKHNVSEFIYSCLHFCYPKVELKFPTQKDSKFSTSPFYICCPGFASFKHLWYMNPELFKLLINKHILINNNVPSPVLCAEHSKSANHYSKHFPSIHSCQCPLARDHQKQTTGHDGKAKLTPAMEKASQTQLRRRHASTLSVLFKDCSFLSDSYKRTPSVHFPLFPFLQTDQI